MAENVGNGGGLRVLTESTTLEEAASRLGINATTLWRKRKRYGIE